MENLKDLAAYCRKFNPAALLYTSFVDIPTRIASENFIIAWITAGGKLSEIPKEQRTELIMRVSVNYDVHALQFISRGDVGDYRSLVIDSFNHSASTVSQIDREYLTEELVVKFVSEEIVSFWYLDLGRSNEHLQTEAVMSAVASHGVGGVWYLKAKYGSDIGDKFNDSFITGAIKANWNAVHRLKNIGKEHLLDDLLRSGYWPNTFDPLLDMKAGYTLDISLPPKNPLEAMSRLAEIQGEDARYLHLATLKSYPIEDVISTTATLPHATDILLEAYSEAELRPHMRLSRALRGRLLESSLGL